MIAPERTFVSLIVPCRNEGDFIEACLESLVRNGYPADRREIVIVDGQSTDRTRAIACEYSRRHPGIRVIDNPRGTIPAAMNIGIKAARGDAVLKIDAHSTYPPDYVSRCVELLFKSGADNVGGVLVTRPRTDGAVAKAIALVLAHPLGSGNSGFRIGTSEPRWADTAAFGCYRSDVFKRIGFYNEDLVRSSDMDINSRLRRAGGRILLDPSITAEYYPVAELRMFAWRNLLDGFWATYPLRFGATFIRWRHIVPVLCLALAAMLVTMAIASVPMASALLAACFVTYAITVVAMSCRLAGREHRIALVVPLGVAFVSRHAAYAFGSLWGVVRALASAEFAKRAFDVVVAVACLVVTSPLLMLSAAAVRLHDAGPIFYRGERIGLEGRPFSMLKFRTMVPGAACMGATSTSSDDVRLTPVGKVLRRFKLDELPQLVNVAKGEMSLVGPRPQVKWAVDLYDCEERTLLTVRPGITDYASIRFRNEAEILRGSTDPDRTYLERIAPEKIRLGLQYVAERSFMVDVLILLATVWTMCGGNPSRLLGRRLDHRALTTTGLAMAAGDPES